MKEGYFNMKCENLNSTWDSKTDDIVIKDTPLDVIKNIVATNDVLIYKEDFKFKSLLADYLSFNEEDKKTLKLLRIIIENGGAKTIYSYVGLPDSKFYYKVRSMLLKMSTDTFIPQEILSEGVSLLCQGLNKKFDFIEQNTKSEQLKQNSQQSPFEINSQDVLTSYNGTEPDVSLPFSVIKIDEFVFLNCTTLKSLILSNSVIEIGYSAFSNCISLKTIQLSNSLIKLGDCVFRECISLESITIPNSLLTINHYTFSNCISLKSISLPNSLTEIGVYAFLNCTSLKSIELPYSLTNVGDYAFLNCTSLKTLTFHNSSTKISDSSFLNCTTLTDIYIKKGITNTLLESIKKYLLKVKKVNIHWI